MNSKWKWAGICLLAFSGFAVGGALSHSFRVSWGGSTDINYSDLISIILTALSLLITILAIFLAVLGVLGWNSIARGVEQKTTELFTNRLGEDGDIRALILSKARSDSEHSITQQFGVDGAMTKFVRQQVEAFIYAGVEPVQSDKLPTPPTAEAKDE